MLLTKVSGLDIKPISFLVITLVSVSKYKVTQDFHSVDWFFKFEINSLASVATTV